MPSTTPPPSEVIPTKPPVGRAGDAPLTSPLLVWLTIQLLALATSLMRVPLAAGYPRPAELLAAQVMIITQVAVSALLFPWLMRSAASVIVTITTAWPFIALAGAVSGVPVTRLLDAGCYVTTWMIALGAWSVCAPKSTRGAAVAAASLVAACSLVFFYLWLEFAPGAAQDERMASVRWAVANPALAALGRLATPQSAREYSIPIAVVVASVGCRFFARRRRQVIHRV